MGWRHEGEERLKNVWDVLSPLGGMETLLGRQKGYTHERF